MIKSIPPASARNGSRVRPLRAADAAAVQVLARALRRWFSPHDLREIEELLRERPSGLVADFEGRMIGFLLDAPTADPHVLEIAWMAVDEAWQRRGIGSALLDHLLAALPGQGVRAVEVSTVAESAGYAPYAATRAFYHRHGFVDQRVDLDYYWPGGDRLLLRRTV